MIPATRTAVRTSARRAARPARASRAARSSPFSTAAETAGPSSAPPPPPNSTHLASGLAGGAVALLGVYGYYHYSGTAKVVSSTKSALAQAEKAKQQLVNATPSPEEALGLLKSFAKSYAAAIPGAAGAIDAFFEKVETASKEHGEEVKEVVQGLYDELKKAMADGEKGGEKVVKALQKAAEKLSEVVGVQGEKLWEKLGDLPGGEEVKKAVGGGGEELKKLADKHGPEAQRIASDAYNQASKIISSGGLNAETFEKVKKLLEQKKDEVTKLAKAGAGDAWEASGPMLEKMPDVKKLWQEKLGDLKEYVGEDNVKAAKEFSEGLEKIAKSGKPLADQQKEATKLFNEKVGGLGDLKKKALEAKDAATKKAAESGGDVAKYLEKVPGFEELSKIVGGQDLQSLKELAEKHGDKGKKVLESTYEDIKKVLKEKAEEGKKIADDAKKDAKK
ncbi:hypothetical protein MNV49_007854 [Pseudohyphozyma bogoriensis]|nr:hypothetical protein MNV49_007854 [Pseudohyphozyma bogoriensis]